MSIIAINHNFKKCRIKLLIIFIIDEIIEIIEKNLRLKFCLSSLSRLPPF